MDKQYTYEELNRKGAKPLARWLIEAALSGGTLTYGEAALRLQEELGYSYIFAAKTGGSADQLMEAIQRVELDVPLLSVLLVRKSDEMPSEGAGAGMAERFGEPLLAEKNANTKYPDLWKTYFKKAENEVRSYKKWPEIFRAAFGEDFEIDSHSAPSQQASFTDDGRHFYSGGEGDKHKALRLWALENPTAVSDIAVWERAATEVVLLSADRVDVVYYTPKRIIAVEVKSIISNDLDLERGVYQCIKYRAVLRAMYPRTDVVVDAILLTQRELPENLRELCKLHSIKHKIAAINETT